MAQPTSCQALGQRHRSGHTDYTKRPFSCGSLPYVPSLRAKSIRTRASATLPLLTEHTEHDGQGTEHASGRGSVAQHFPSSRLRTVWAKQLSPSGLNRSGFPGGHLVWVKRPRRAPWCGHSSALRPRREGYSRWVQAGRRVLNQSTHSRVANSTASKERHGPRRWITSALKRPLIVSARALS